MIRHYVKAMAARGYNATAVLAGSGIFESQLSSPSLLVDARQCDTVVNNMLRLTGNPALGFDIGETARLPDLGVLAHAMMSSNTLEDARRVFFRFYNLLEIRIGLAHESTSNGGAVTVCDTLDVGGPVQRFYVEERAMLATRVGGELLGEPYRYSECVFAYPAPEHANLYSEKLGCKIRFGGHQNLFFDSESLLKTPLRGSDPEFHEVCLRHCKRIMQQIFNDKSVTAKLRSLVLGKPSDIPPLPAVAQLFGMSARSLRRYLQQEGTSYQSIIDATRLDLAKEYLKTEQLLVKQIAGLIGYRSTRSFSRAFKNWTGTTVEQYREL